MTSQTIAFRSQTEREKETRLLEHYKQIGIASIAAAASAIRSRQPKTPVFLATRPALRTAE